MHALVARESRLMKAPVAKMQAGSNSVQRLQPSIPTPALLYDRLWLRKYMKELKKEGEDKRKKDRKKTLKTDTFTMGTSVCPLHPLPFHNFN